MYHREYMVSKEFSELDWFLFVFAYSFVCDNDYSFQMGKELLQRYIWSYILYIHLVIQSNLICKTNKHTNKQNSHEMSLYMVFLLDDCNFTSVNRFELYVPKNLLICKLLIVSILNKLLLLLLTNKLNCTGNSPYISDMNSHSSTYTNLSF